MQFGHPFPRCITVPTLVITIVRVHEYLVIIGDTPLQINASSLNSWRIKMPLFNFGL